MTNPTLPSPDTPVYAYPESQLFPTGVNLAGLMDIPPSRMFLIKKSLAIYKHNHPGSPAYDASQGDGGASLPGTSPEILMRAAEMQVEQGTSYDMPYGTDAYRKSVIETYWQADSSSGLGPKNVLAATGGRDALVKAFQAMLALGYGCQGDAIITSRVPWISYNWGTYGIGANSLLAPGRPEDGWEYTEEGIRACVEYAARSGRHAAGIIITSPDNPTGRTLTPERQAILAKAALDAGVAFVLFDWIYHYITDEQPIDINAVYAHFTPAECERIMVLDGLTKSLGGSNIRSAHLIASEKVVNFIIARASHGVIPSFYSLAVAMAAYEMGFDKACATINEPTNASRKVLGTFLSEHNFRYILGKGYYAFIDVGEWVDKAGWTDTEPMGEYLAREHGLATVPGIYFSADGGKWLRFSYAQPPENTKAAAERLMRGLETIQNS
ncbi:MAG TPA: pyridoxal phosphate-dependent aminotransferase [Anaerolineales bacterium]|nr:pyridoxal phosphate-dependent aminotransferase [Anaerolineales bacterium]